MHTHFEDGIIFRFDSYKAGHPGLMKPSIKHAYSYLESRGGRWDSTIFFGLQYYLKRYMVGARVTMDDVAEATEFWHAHFGRKDYFQPAKWEYIVKEHGGHLPLRIKAVKEGSNVPVSNALMSIEDTDSECAWLANGVETLLMKVWYPTSVATQSHLTSNDIYAALVKSGDPAGLPFKCHDFGYRGCTSEESAAIGAAAHLLSFMGTDTVAGIRLLQRYYKAAMCGFSIPATEHSNICPWGKDGEEAFFAAYLKQFPSGTIACVSDTYDVFKACEEKWGCNLREQVMARDGCLVIRPDSGDFMEIIPKLFDILYRRFGGTVNEKGYKVLDPHVRLIQGDGMKAGVNPTIRALYSHILEMGWSADNLAVGSGGGLLVEDLTRDTAKFAIKASAIFEDGVWKGIQKSPITDSGKMSKKGRLALVNYRGHEWTTVPENLAVSADDKLEVAFENGKLIREQTLDEVKTQIAATS